MIKSQVFCLMDNFLRGRFLFLNKRHFAVGVVEVIVIEILDIAGSDPVGPAAVGMETVFPVKEDTLTAVIDHLIEDILILLKRIFLADMQTVVRTAESRHAPGMQPVPLLSFEARMKA